ncbi:MAG TPA: hypothetical protein VLM76_14965 [Patescibacteria group bacterium]|nr:hypothetical protein [Patescibacteria group bacterium]
MTARPPDDRADELPPAEAARARRRDHDAAAAERSGMRTGLAKQFKQVLDAQARRGRPAGADDDEPPPASRPPSSRRRKRGKPVGRPGPPSAP